MNHKDVYYVSLCVEFWENMTVSALYQDPSVVHLYVAFCDWINHAAMWSSSLHSILKHLFGASFLSVNPVKGSVIMYHCALEFSSVTCSYLRNDTCVCLQFTIKCSVLVYLIFT